MGHHYEGLWNWKYSLYIQTTRILVPLDSCTRQRLCEHHFSNKYKIEAGSVRLCAWESKRTYWNAHVHHVSQLNSVSRWEIAWLSEQVVRYGRSSWKMFKSMLIFCSFDIKWGGGRFRCNCRMFVDNNLRDDNTFKEWELGRKLQMP